jgi:hypothetical protein
MLVLVLVLEIAKTTKTQPRIAKTKKQRKKTQHRNKPGCKMPASYVLFLLESYFLLLTSYFKTKGVERCPKPEAESA